MNLDWIKELPSKETPFNKSFFEKLSSSILEYSFPIGKTEIFYDIEDHSNYLGFKWERTCIGRVPVGIDSSDTDFNSIGKTGGEKEHTLTNAEMPKHRHNISTIGKTSTWEAPNIAINYQYTSADTIKQSEVMSYEGGSVPHNNLQPYEVVAFWKRIE